MPARTAGTVIQPFRLAAQGAPDPASSTGKPALPPQR